MAILPSAGSDSTVGVLISTTADDGAIKTTQAELTVLGDTAAKAAASAASSFETFTKNLKNVGQQMTETGRSMTTAFTLPIAGIGFEAVKSALSFQQAMTYIRTDAGDTTDDITKLGDAVLDLSRKSQFGPEQLAQGLYHLASLGLRGADAMNALNTAQQMASVGGSDLESTASALGGALVTGIRGVQDYASAAGVLDATIGAGNMRMQDLVNAIGTGVLPVFKNAGLSITDFGAALATLTDNGQDASAAATHLRMTVALMEAPSQKAADVMKSIGLSANQLGMDMQTKGLIPALEDLKTHLLDTFGTTDAGRQQMAAALTEMFGGGRSSSAIQTLIDQLDRVQTKESQINEQSGEFAQKVGEQQATAAAQFKTAWSGVQADLIQLGDSILPSVVHLMDDLAHGINGVSDWYEKLSPNQKQFAIDAAAVLAVSGPLLMFFGGIAKGVSNILDLGGTVGGGLFGKDGLFSKLGDVASSLPGLFKSGGSIAANWASTLSDMVRNSASAAGSFAKDAAGTAASWASTALDIAKSSAKTAASFAVDALKAAGSWIKAAHDSEIGLGGTLIKMAVDSTRAAASFVRDSVTTAAAWVASAAKSAFAWVTVTLPQMIASFVKTAAEATVNAVASSAAWVKEAAVSTAAWVASSAKVIAAWVAQTAVAVAQGAIEAAVWVANTAKVVAYAVAIDAAKTATYVLGGATVAQGALMAGVFAGIAADVYLIVKAIQTVQGAMDAMNAANQSAKEYAASKAQTHQTLLDLQAHGDPGQKARATALLSEGYATGTNYARAGWHSVGENGPEAMYVPQGAMIKTNPQTSSMPGGSQGITINQTNHNYSMFDLEQANRELSWRLSNAAI